MDINQITEAAFKDELQKISAKMDISKITSKVGKKLGAIMKKPAVKNIGSVSAGVGSIGGLAYLLRNKKDKK